MKTILFNHIPKTGGRSIARHFRKNVNNFHKRGVNLDLLFNSTMHNLQKEYSRFEVTGNFIFTIIRHPYERYVSAVNHLNTFDDTVGTFINNLNTTKKNIDLNLDLIVKLPDIRNNHLIFRDQIKHINLLRHDLIHRYDRPFVEIVKKVNEIYNVEFPLEIENFNISNHIFKVSDLTAEQKKRIEELYPNDFEIYEIN
jgi:hypothetical protein